MVSIIVKTSQNEGEGLSWSKRGRREVNGVQDTKKAMSSINSSMEMYCTFGGCCDINIKNIKKDNYSYRYQIVEL